MGNQGTVSHKFQKLGKNLFDFRLALQHLVGNAGQLCILRCQQAFGVHKGLEAIHFLAVFEDDCAHLCNAVINGT